MQNSVKCVLGQLLQVAK